MMAFLFAALFFGVYLIATHTAERPVRIVRYDTPSLGTRLRRIAVRVWTVLDRGL